MTVGKRTALIFCCLSLGRVAMCTLCLLVAIDEYMSVCCTLAVLAPRGFVSCMWCSCQHIQWEYCLSLFIGRCHGNKAHLN